MPRVINKQLHKDCPFSKKELMGFYDMLYQVNVGNHCMNPPHPSWIAGSQMFEQHCMQTGKSSETLLREENEMLRKQLEDLKNGSR